MSMREYNWPEGYCEHSDCQLEGPEAKPGNMKMLYDLIKLLTQECVALRGRISQLEASGGKVP